MPNPISNTALKAQILDTIRGPGGLPDLFNALGELLREMATDRCEVMQDEREAQLWEDLARAMDSAATKALPLRRIT